VIFQEYFPRSAIDIFVEVLQADAVQELRGLTLHPLPWLTQAYQ